MARSHRQREQKAREPDPGLQQLKALRDYQKAYFYQAASNLQQAESAFLKGMPIVRRMMTADYVERRSLLKDLIEITREVAACCEVSIRCQQQADLHSQCIKVFEEVLGMITHRTGRPLASRQNGRARPKKTHKAKPSKVRK